jgi:hypothetical protein
MCVSWAVRPLVTAITASLLLCVSGLALAEDDKFAAGEDDATGTDPRSFGPKFMPYYRYTELDNDLEQQEAVAFGLIRFSERAALTYEIPLAYKRDVRDTALRDPVSGTCGGNLGGGPPDLPGGLPVGGDCEKTGMGDMNLRFLYKAGRGLGGDWLVGSQFNLPTASDDVLGSDQFQIGPMFAYVKDFDWYPAPGAFGAFMNFYFFDVFGDNDREDVSYYIGRWFFMFPLTPPDKGPILGGWYALPEVQPIYDFEEDHFSFWAGPEIGKMLAPGRIMYFKPGFGVDPEADKGDRDWTFEVGFRWFLE